MKCFADEAWEEYAYSNLLLLKTADKVYLIPKGLIKKSDVDEMLSILYFLRYIHEDDEDD